MSGFGNNGNGMGYNPFAQNNLPNNGMNLGQQFTQNIGVPGNVANTTLNPAQLALLAQQQRQQQQQQIGQFQQNRPIATRTNSPNPQQFLNMQNAAGASTPARSVTQEQLTAAIAKVVSNRNLHPDVRRAILGGQLPAEKILQLAAAASQPSFNPSSPGMTGSSQFTPNQGIQNPQVNRAPQAQFAMSIAPQSLVANRNRGSFSSPVSQGSPNTTPIPLASANPTLMQRQLSGGQGFNPSVMPNPPQTTSIPARLPSPPAVAGRQQSFNQMQQAAPMENKVSTPQAALANPSTAANASINPNLAAAIPPAPPASFKLDESKLKARKPNTEVSSTTIANGGQAGSGAPSMSSSFTAPPTAPTAAPISTPSFPPKPMNGVPSSASTIPRTPAPYVPSAPFRHAGAPRPVEGRYVEYAGERKKGMEGMRGSMRNELARLMYAAGDVPEPDVNSVDYMEDLVVEFLADLCRPVPPMRANVGAAHYPVPLTTNIVRERLASRPVFKKYLERFDIMTYLTGEINRSRRTFQNQESYNDLVETVGRDYLEMDAEQKAKAAAANKKRGRPKKAGEGDDGEAEKDEPQVKRKPGPKKGWKAARGGIKVEGEALRIGADGGKIKKPYKRKKKDGTAGAREASVVSGGEGHDSS